MGPKKTRAPSPPEEEGEVLVIRGIDEFVNSMASLATEAETTARHAMLEEERAKVEAEWREQLAKVVEHAASRSASQTGDDALQFYGPLVVQLRKTAPTKACEELAATTLRELLLGTYTRTDNKPFARPTIDVNVSPAPSTPRRSHRRSLPEPSSSPLRLVPLGKAPPSTGPRRRPREADSPALSPLKVARKQLPRTLPLSMTRLLDSDSSSSSSSPCSVDLGAPVLHVPKLPFRQHDTAQRSQKRVRADEDDARPMRLRSASPFWEEPASRVKKWVVEQETEAITYSPLRTQPSQRLSQQIDEDTIELIRLAEQARNFARRQQADATVRVSQKSAESSGGPRRREREETPPPTSQRKRKGGRTSATSPATPDSPSTASPTSSRKAQKPGQKRGRRGASERMRREQAKKALASLFQ